MLRWVHEPRGSNEKFDIKGRVKSWKLMVVQDADRQSLQHRVVASERGRLEMPGESGPKAICGTLRLSAHFAVISSVPLELPPCNTTKSW